MTLVGQLRSWPISTPNGCAGADAMPRINPHLPVLAAERIAELETRLAASAQAERELEAEVKMWRERAARAEAAWAAAERALLDARGAGP